MDVKQDKLALDGDQIIMLYVYIAAKSQIKNLFAQVAFCKEFSTPYIKTTRMGYCLTTMEVALTLLTEEAELIDMAADDDTMNEENMFDNQQNQHRNSIRKTLRNSILKT